MKNEIVNQNVNKRRSGERQVIEKRSAVKFVFTTLSFVMPSHEI